VKLAPVHSELLKMRKRSHHKRIQYVLTQRIKKTGPCGLLEFSSTNHKSLYLRWKYNTHKSGYMSHHRAGFEYTIWAS